MCEKQERNLKMTSTDVKAIYYELSKYFLIFTDHIVFTFSVMWMPLKANQLFCLDSLQGNVKKKT